MNETRYHRDDALRIANIVVEMLRPECHRIEIAGSIRRQKPTVKDIEILYIPKFDNTLDGQPPATWDDSEESEPIDLFTVCPSNRANDILRHMLSEGLIRKRKNSKGSEMWGTKNKYAQWTGETPISIDFFATREACWFNYLVCRTGPAEFNTLIASRARARGWKWTPYGPGFTSGCHRSKSMESEREVMEFVGLPYHPPQSRGNV